QATIFNSTVEIFTDRAKFLQSAGTVTNVNFDQTACGSTITGPVAAAGIYANLGLTFTRGAIGPSLSAQSAPNTIFGQIPPGFPSSLPPAEIRGSFVQSVYAIGATNVGLGAQLWIFDAAGRPLTIAQTDTDSTTADFLGIVSLDPFASFAFFGAHGVTADDFVFTSIAVADCVPPTLQLPG